MNDCVNQALLGEARRRLRPLAIRIHSATAGIVLEGDVETYGYSRNNLHELIAHVHDMAIGLDPEESIEWPMTALPSGKVADVKWIHFTGERYCVLLDVSELHAALFARQQTANEGLLLDEERQRYIQALETSQQDLNRKAIQMDALQHRQKSMLNGLVHDLGTPLTSILGYTALLKRQLLQADIRERALESIQSGAEYIKTLREDLMRLAQGDAATPGATQPTPVDLHLLAAKVQTMFGNQATDKGIDLLISVDSQSRAASTLDSFRLERIVMNLVSNAVRYTSKGYVCVNLASDREGIEIVVSDSGAGIEKEQIDLIFKPFVRSSKDHSGMGLGLYLVKEFVEALYGTVVLESKVGAGTMVTVKLPDIEKITQSPLDKPLTERPSRTIKNDSVAIVEDNLAVVELLQMTLSEVGLVATRVTDPSTLQAYVEQNDPGAIVIDYRLPGRSGLHLSQNLRLAGYDGLIVLCTGEADPKLEEAAYRIGIDWFLTKPFSIESLQRKFRAAREHPSTNKEAEA